MRPKTIAAFEIIQIALLVLGYILSPTDDVILKTVGFVFVMALVLFIARKRSNIARWLFFAMVALGLLIQAWLWIAQPVELPPLTAWYIARIIFGLMVSLVSVGLLFTPSASAWLRRGSQVTTSG
ncbi:hypothetical protein [Sphingomonas alpina]|uniref:Uncharacterized protein n=1 Tax=Sphingomonas alpina TaxID=653931 RepID=A0A7H0LFI0_9SPHN|nr:hypothetical protein [Sphingomonas alpina]QNQ08433.1 hypothetical protein H3Z74_16995 [Sphingomonas alpina]